MNTAEPPTSLKPVKQLAVASDLVFSFSEDESSPVFIFLPFFLQPFYSSYSAAPSLKP